MQDGQSARDDVAQEARAALKSGDLTESEAKFEQAMGRL